MNTQNQVVIINNIEFEQNLGKRILKTLGEYEDETIEKIDFKTCATIENLEQRRVAMNALGIDEIIKNVDSKLIDEQVLKKTTTWIDPEGKKHKKIYEDKYSLFEIEDSSVLGFKKRWDGKSTNLKYVLFKDTSTDRKYLIWVDSNINDAIEAIAWTITTDIREGNIEKIIRQGDCIFLKEKDTKENLMWAYRHLTKEEYINYLKIES